MNFRMKKFYQSTNLWSRKIVVVILLTSGMSMEKRSYVLSKVILYNSYAPI